MVRESISAEILSVVDVNSAAHIETTKQRYERQPADAGKAQSKAGRHQDTDRSGSYTTRGAACVHCEAAPSEIRSDAPKKPRSMRPLQVGKLRFVASVVAHTACVNVQRCNRPTCGSDNNISGFGRPQTPPRAITNTSRSLPAAMHWAGQAARQCYYRLVPVYTVMWAHRIHAECDIPQSPLRAEVTSTWCTCGAWPRCSGRELRT